MRSREVVRASCLTGASLGGVSLLCAAAHATLFALVPALASVCGTGGLRTVVGVLRVALFSA